jgi:hypothetical protein
MPYTVYPARRATTNATWRQLWESLWQFPHILGLGGGSLALILILSSWTTSLGVNPAGASSPAQNPSSGAPESWLDHASILAVYGRGFHTAPVLGRLGMVQGFDDLRRRTAPARAAIGRLTGHRPVRLAIHLIYGMAAPCSSANDNCLVYLDDEPGVDLVHDYILPAARRGWLVILDDQLGRSNPAQEIARLKAKGYLAYDNVEVAFDPEFHTLPDQTTPGSPMGQVSAQEINNAQQAMEGAMAGTGLAHRKLLLIHQWTPTMILDRMDLVTGLKDVQPAVVMDGIGPANEKVGAYNSLMSNGLPRGVTPGIKLFLPNPYGVAGNDDVPVLTWPEVLGQMPVMGQNGIPATVSPVPRIVVIS